ncbi:MAG: ATP-binding cassette domain-containing protein [Anaerolineae bacterium]|nr:ATP-binding cassette domain-containing protein [Anaerolineae bacterium]
MISFHRFSYTYPGRTEPALHELSLSIQPGEFVLVAGASGSGKSTWLRAINGLVPHFTGGRVSGQLLVNGLDAIKAGPQQLSRQVGFVWQNPEAQAVLDRVEAEVAFGLENAGLPPSVMRQRVAEALAWLELIPLRDRLISTLSGGERQRVAIASALALRPPILVLDEPTSQLDPASACEVLDALTRLHQQLGLTIILAEHRLERVLGIVDKMIWLDRGRLIDHGLPDEVIANHSSVPPVVALGRELGWHPIPLTVAEARKYLAYTPVRPAPASLPQVTRPQPLLTVHNLSYAYDDRPALQNVSLQVGMGEVVAVMGANGSGKTTLLKNIVGLLRPHTGEIQLEGHSLMGQTIAETCRHLAYLPQNPDDLLFAESVRAEMSLTLSNQKRPTNREQIEHLLEKLGLNSVGQQYPRDLSVGQRQRVALGAVMVVRPRLLLLDEPTRGLDFQAKQNLSRLWRHWLAEGMGILLITHDVELVAQMAHYVMIMHQGKVLTEGHPAAVLPHHSPFKPQIAQLFPGQPWLTVQDALKYITPAQQNYHA